MLSPIITKEMTLFPSRPLPSSIKNVRSRARCIEHLSSWEPTVGRIETAQCLSQQHKKKQQIQFRQPRLVNGAFGVGDCRFTVGSSHQHRKFSCLAVIAEIDEARSVVQLGEMRPHPSSHSFSSISPTDRDAMSVGATPPAITASELVIVADRLPVSAPSATPCPGNCKCSRSCKHQTAKYIAKWLRRINSNLKKEQLPAPCSKLRKLDSSLSPN